MSTEWALVFSVLIGLAIGIWTMVILKALELLPWQ
jgi:hypothetical protein